MLEIDCVGCGFLQFRVPDAVEHANGHYLLGTSPQKRIELQKAHLLDRANNVLVPGLSLLLTGTLLHHFLYVLTSVRTRDEVQIGLRQRAELSNDFV